MGTMWSESLPDFLLVTVLLGGGAAYLVGRAVARTWRPLTALAGYLLLLDCAVRFIHFALAGDVLVAPASFVIDLIVLGIVGGLGFRLTRVDQVSRQYPWLFRRTGPLSWGPREHDPQP